MEMEQNFKNIAISLNNIKPFSFNCSAKDKQDFSFFEASSESFDNLLLCLKKQFDTDISSCFTSFYRFEKETSHKPIFIFQFPLNRGQTHELVKNGIPFFDSKGQSFVPFMTLSLNLYNEFATRNLNYSSCCQQIASVFLLSNLETISTGDLMTFLRVSQPTISRSLDYFIGNDLIEKVGAQNKTRYRIRASKSDFLKIVLSQSINPIIQSYYVDKEHLPDVKMDIFSSESALEKFASLRPLYKAYVAHKIDIPLISEKAAHPWALLSNVDYVRFDVLTYKPLLFGKNYLNPIDVYAIYQSDSDIRIKKALEIIVSRLLV